MARVMVDLWRGRLYPSQYCGEGNAELRRLERELADGAAALRARLTDEQAALFEKYADGVREYVELMAGEAFGDGYSLAVKVTFDAMHRAETLCE